MFALSPSVVNGSREHWSVSGYLITHSNKKIKCDYCDYSNPDIRNVCTHSAMKASNGRNRNDSTSESVKVTRI